MHLLKLHIPLWIPKTKDIMKTITQNINWANRIFPLQRAGFAFRYAKKFLDFLSFCTIRDKGVAFVNIQFAYPCLFSPKEVLQVPSSPRIFSSFSQMSPVMLKVWRTSSSSARLFGFLFPQRTWRRRIWIASLWYCTLQRRKNGFHIQEMQAARRTTNKQRGALENTSTRYACQPQSPWTNVFTYLH